MSSFIEEVLQALRYSVRQLRKSPGFTTVVTVTLALGIGANTAVFSVMDAVLLRSLPVRNPQELVYLHTSDFPGGQTGYGDTSMRMQVYEALRPEKRVFADLIAWVPLSTTGGVPARFGTEPEEIKADMVSGNFFSGLGVPSVRGRTFNLEDEQKHTQVAILSYDYWTRRFARDPAVAGQTFFIKGCRLPSSVLQHRTSWGWIAAARRMCGFHFRSARTSSLGVFREDEPRITIKQIFTDRSGGSC